MVRVPRRPVQADSGPGRLGSQIHAISDETHREIHALLTAPLKELEMAMQQREHNGRENRRPAAASPQPSSPR